MADDVHMQCIIKYALPLMLFSACSQSIEFTDENVYTLYHDSPYLLATEGSSLEAKWMRVHLASFDAVDMDSDYNKVHCERVRDFYVSALRGSGEPLPEYYANFWCEAGRYKIVREPN